MNHKTLLNSCIFVAIVLAGICVGCTGIKTSQPTPQNKKEATLSLYSAIKNQNVPGVKEAIKAGADVNARYEDFLPECENPKGDMVITCTSTLLSDAISKGNVQIVELLTKAGADVNAGFGEVTPLQWACQDKKPAVAIALIKAGANVKYVNPVGAESTSMLKACAEYPEVVKLLKAYGAK